MIRFPTPFTYAAMDADGEWHLFKSKPTIGYTAWNDNGFGGYLLLPAEYPEWEGPWKESLLEHSQCEEVDTLERVSDAFMQGIIAGKKLAIKDMVP